MEVGEDEKFVSKLCLHEGQLAFISIVLQFLVMVLLGCKVLGWKLLGWNKPTCFSFVAWYETMCSKDADFLHLLLPCLFGGTVVVDGSLSPQVPPFTRSQSWGVSPQPPPSARQDFSNRRERSTKSIFWSETKALGGGVRGDWCVCVGGGGILRRP